MKIRGLQKMKKPGASASRRVGMIIAKGQTASASPTHR